MFGATAVHANGQTPQSEVAPQGAFTYYEVPARQPDTAYQQPPQYPSGNPANVAIQAAAQPGGKWAAVAVSTDPRKDAYGFDYLKDSAAGAMNAAKSFCEQRLRKYGLANGQCTVRASQNFVIGLYCRSGSRLGFVGEGVSPDAAANDAIKQAADAQSSDCDFKAIRHGSLDKAIMRDAQWSASMQCGGRTFNGTAANGTAEDNAAIVALNQSFLRCGSRPAGCQVLAYSHPR
jgi:hypothetical protein